MLREIFQVNSTNCPGGLHSLSTDGSIIAIVQKTKIAVKDCKGKQMHDIQLECLHDVLATDWNSNGDYLVIVYENFDHVTLWNKLSNESALVHIGFKDPSFLLWSSISNVFIIGTKKGNLFIYNVESCLSDTILGKHSLEITCGTWTSNNILVLGCNDKTISLSSSDGRTIQIISLDSIPKSISFSSINTCCYITASMDSKLCFYDISNQKLNVVKYPVNLGSVRGHLWQPDCSSVLIVTSRGYFFSQPNPFGQDSKYKMLDYNTSQIQVCAACTATQSFVLIDDDDNISLIQSQKNKIAKVFSVSINDVTHVNISRNGKMLLASKMGTLHAIQCHASTLLCTHGDNIAFLSSRRNVTITDWKRQNQLHIEIDHDCQTIALGPNHLIIGYDNLVNIYDRSSQPKVPGFKTIQLAEHAMTFGLSEKLLVIQTKSALLIHDLSTIEEKISVNYQNDTNYINTFIVTSAFLIYGTKQGDVCFFYLQTNKESKDLKITHNASIEHMCSNGQGSVVLFVDDEARGFLYDTFSQELLPVASLPPVRKIIWDQSYEGVFYIFDGQDVHSFIVYLTSIRGVQVAKLGEILIAEDGQTHIIKKDKGYTLSSDFTPLVCQKGEIICQSIKDGSFKSFPSDAFTGVSGGNFNLHEYISFLRCLSLNLLQDAWLRASSIDSTTCWKALGNKALEMMDIQTAILAFQKLREVAVVAKLEDIQSIEEKNLLSGHLAVLFGDYDLAESKFMMSSAPFEALEMRRNFGQWNEALALAMDCFPNQIKKISLSLANELETLGDLRSALDTLEHAMTYQDDNTHDNEQLVSKIAEICLRLGNRTKAFALTEKHATPTLYSTLASILEEQNDYEVAAQFYEQGGQIENAIKLQMKLKHIDQVSKLIKSNHIFMDKEFYNDLASLCMENGQMELAVDAFESAQNYMAAMKIWLTVLNNSSKALEIMRKQPCKTFALKASEICKHNQDFKSALEFLILGQRFDEAFTLAASTNCIDDFVLLMGEGIPPHMAEKIGKYYELIGNDLMAAEFYSQSPQYIATALDIYLRQNRFKEALNLADQSIDLANQFISFQMKSNGNHTLDQKFCLYNFCLKNNLWEEVMSIAETIMIEQMMEQSDYQNAYKIASKTIMALRKMRITMTLSFLALFNILHSYQLAKRFLQKADHKSSAKLLARVSENIQMFPSRDHFNLYISTIVECSRCEFYQLALKYWKIISADNELKTQLETSSLKRKIESIVHRIKSSSDHKKEEYSTFSTGFEVAVPICICSGHFLTDESDWVFCPVSNMPAILSEYINFSNLFGTDPMFDKTISLSQLKKASKAEVNEYLEQYSHV